MAFWHSNPNRLSQKYSSHQHSQGFQITSSFLPQTWHSFHEVYSIYIISAIVTPAEMMLCIYRGALVIFFRLVQPYMSSSHTHSDLDPTSYRSLHNSFSESKYKSHSLSTSIPWHKTVPLSPLSLGPKALRISWLIRGWKEHFVVFTHEFLLSNIPVFC